MPSSGWKGVGTRQRVAKLSLVLRWFKRCLDCSRRDLSHEPAVLCAMLGEGDLTSLDA